MDAGERGYLMNKLADLIERDRKYLAVSHISLFYDAKEPRASLNPCI